VRVLLDEQLPRHLARELHGHEVSTVQQKGWAGLKNGELLQCAADAGFEVFVTADRNLEFQQNLSQTRLRVILLVVPSNALRGSTSACTWLAGLNSQEPVRADTTR
jgi:predicted nuclease of predicted toxin-antitoxin system